VIDFDATPLDWSKGGGLLPAIVQHAFSGEVLMLGWMNAKALEITQCEARVTFWSRSRQCLWRKGETSGHVLDVQSIRADCDGDALLISVLPQGPTCHLGARSCFGEAETSPLLFLGELEALLRQRHDDRPAGSYTSNLFNAGVQRIAQKVGEEGVETALAAVTGDKDALLNESADLLFHLMALLRAQGMSLNDVARMLRQRHAPLVQA